MREIILANGRGVALVDGEAYEAVMAAGPWCLHSTGYVAHHVRRPGGGWTTQYLHQFLMGYRDGLTVDHINHNGLDCRRQNMRWATQAQQQAHRRRRSDGTSGYIGVSWHRRDGKWRARIEANGRKRFLGLFDNIEDAARAYDRAALARDAEFAVLNFPCSDYS